jgi:small subunit ribosomal protein S17
MSKKVLKGVVVSDKMDKTVVVKVERLKKHPKYLKTFRVHTKYSAHDEKNEYTVGDKVLIKETNPISKSKKWIVKGKNEK